MNRLQPFDFKRKSCSNYTLEASLYNFKERINVLDDVIGFDSSSYEMNVRLSLLEAKLVFLEKKFPEISSQFFNYDLLRKEKGQRRTSKLGLTDAPFKNPIKSLIKTKTHIVQMISRLD